MQTTSERIEAKQDQLNRLDPDKERQLTDMYVEYIASVHRDRSKTREERSAEEKTATTLYECVLDGALEDERQKFYRTWDETDEETREIIYPYMQPDYQTWLDQREEA